MDTTYEDCTSYGQKIKANVKVDDRLKDTHTHTQRDKHTNKQIYRTTEKGKDLTQTYDKSPYSNRKFKKAKWQHKSTTKNFEYITIVDRLWLVSWSNDSCPTGVVKPAYGIPLFPLASKAMLSKGYTYIIIIGAH